MRVALISDTHMLGGGRRRLPTACVELMSGCDLVVHAGDVMDAAALAEIEAVGPPVEAVHGNVDSVELRARLPAQRLVELDGAALGVVHDAGPASGRLKRLRRLFPEADAVVFGHSHLPLHDRDGTFQIFNPGSPTERRRAPHQSMGIAQVEAGEITFELVRLG